MNQENLEQLETKLEESKSEAKGGWVNTLAKGLAVAPILLEQFTNQKLPVVGGTLGEIHQTIGQLAVNIQQLSTSLVTVVNNQNKIWQKLTNLENNAQQKLVNLTEQVKHLSNVKLTHEKERKQIEYGSNQNRLGQQEFE